VKLEDRTTLMSEREISLGPCCFCAATIHATEVDPCQVTVETAKGQWQVWFCHAACFKAKLNDPPDWPGVFEPAAS
jgi:hypothetical protein